MELIGELGAIPQADAASRRGLIQAMKCAALVYGATNRYGTISLANATARAGVVWEGDAHSAAADALATAALVHKMAAHA